MSDYPTIALIGPGAIGTTIAAVLHDVGRTPLLCGRTAHPELRLRHDEGETVVPGPVLTDPAVIRQPVDLVFIAVKTTQNADCVIVIGSRLNIRQVSYNWASFARNAFVAQVDIDPAELIMRVREAGAKRPRLTAPVDTVVSKIQVSKVTECKITYGGIEDD